MIAKNGRGTSSKVALVTGASQRIGAAIAAIAHGQGYKVALHYRHSMDAASELAVAFNQDRPDSAICVKADFALPATESELIAACIDKWGQLDLLVNNASEFFPTPVGSIDLKTLETIFSANVYAPLLLAQAAWPWLQRGGGSVVNIVDIYASKVHKDHPVYCASKAAMAMLTKSLAVEFAPAVRVNGVAPGAILWPEGEAALTQDKKDSLLGNIPLTKTGNAAQIANAVMYLAGEDSAFTTGQVITIDGGRTL